MATFGSPPTSFQHQQQWVPSSQHSFQQQVSGQQQWLGPTPTSFAQPQQQMRPAGFGSNPDIQPTVPAPKPAGDSKRGSLRGRANSYDPSKFENACNDPECVEEACDPDDVGDEERPPKDDNTICGVDKRPLLPVALSLSTVVGALCMVMLQLPLMRQLLGSAPIITYLFFALYIVTLSTMAYAALCDPGTISDLKERQALSGKDGDGVPKRAHTTWLYANPIRRYDHYCRWLTNVIGLLNHREFLVMCIGLNSLGFFGGLIDTVLLVNIYDTTSGWVNTVVIVMHLMYSIAIVFLAGPILRIHLGLIFRNELAQEWKKNIFYVVHNNNGDGTVIPVNQLPDDEFNMRFDEFIYDPGLNQFDKGPYENLWRFWCLSRWHPDQMGEF